jgi:hypothetical protein
VRADGADLPLEDNVDDLPVEELARRAKKSR